MPIAAFGIPFALHGENPSPRMRSLSPLFQLLLLLVVLIIARGVMGLSEDMRPTCRPWFAKSKDGSDKQTRPDPQEREPGGDGKKHENPQRP